MFACDWVRGRGEDFVHSTCLVCPEAKEVGGAIDDGLAVEKDTSKNAEDVMHTEQVMHAGCGGS